MTAIDITEKQWMEQIRTLAKQLGYRTYHTHRSRKSEPGFPDLVLVNPRKRRLIFAELKSQTGKLTPVQEQWLIDLRNAGAHAYCWRPDDLQEAARILTGKDTHMT